MTLRALSHEVFEKKKTVQSPHVLDNEFENGLLIGPYIKIKRRQEGEKQNRDKSTPLKLLKKKVHDPKMLLYEETRQVINR